MINKILIFAVSLAIQSCNGQNKTKSSDASAITDSVLTVFYHDNDTAKLIRGLNEAIAVDDSYYQAHFHKAVMYLFSGNYDSTIAICNFLKERNPGNDAAYLYCGLALELNANTREAIINYKKAKDIFLLKERNTNNRVNIIFMDYLISDNRKKALEELSNVKKEDPSHITIGILEEGLRTKTRRELLLFQ